ncbi:hypothetical protein Tco_1251100, partial [Tanacetum coccineum]
MIGDCQGGNWGGIWLVDIGDKKGEQCWVVNLAGSGDKTQKEIYSVPAPILKFGKWQERPLKANEDGKDFSNSRDGYKWQSQVPRNYGGAPAQTRSKRVLKQTFKLMDIVPPTPHNSPLPGGYTPGSDEGRLKLEELMVMQVESCNDDLDEEDASKQGKTSDKTKPMFKDSDFDYLDDLVDEGMDFVQEKDAENQGKIGADDTKAVNTTGEGVITAAPRTPPTTTIVFDDEDVTMVVAQTLIKMKEEKAKEKGVAIKDVEDFSRPIRSITTLQPLPTIDPKDKERDAEIALRLQAELDEEHRVERERQEEASKVAIADMFDEVQARIDADYELDARMTHEEQKKYTIEERARLLAEFSERRKKQLAAERAKAIRNKPLTKTQLRNLMMTYLKNMGGYKHSQLKGKSYEEILGLYERQQKRIQDFTPMDSEKEAQKPAKRLKRVAGSYATQKSPKKPKVMNCGVRTLFMDGKPMEINMLVEKKYPLIKELLEKMQNLQLEAEEESTMAFELIKFIKSLLEE